MPKSSCLRTNFESERVHGCQTFLKRARQDFYPNFSLIQDKLSLENISLSQIWNIQTVW